MTWIDDPKDSPYATVQADDFSKLSMEEVGRKAGELRSCMVDIYGVPSLLLDALGKLEIRFQELRAMQSASTCTPEQLAEVKDQCELGLTFSPEHECPATFALAAIWAELFAPSHTDIEHTDQERP